MPKRILFLIRDFLPYTIQTFIYSRQYMRHIFCPDNLMHYNACPHTKQTFVLAGKEPVSALHLSANPNDSAACHRRRHTRTRI